MDEVLIRTILFACLVIALLFFIFLFIRAFVLWYFKLDHIAEELTKLNKTNSLILNELINANRALATGEEKSTIPYDDR